MAQSASREANLWKWLKRARAHYREDLHMKRVENSVGNGMPDVEGCLCGEQFFLELKCSARPARITTNIKVRFEPEQIPWMIRRSNAGGRAFVFLQIGSGPDAQRYLLRPMDLAEVEAGCTEQRIAQLSIIKKNVKPDTLVGCVAVEKPDRYLRAGL